MTAWRAPIILALRRIMAATVCAAFLTGTMPLPVQAQDDAATTESAPQDYTVEQLDALLAPVALYPDTLLTQVLMASVFPLQIVAAARWLENPQNKALTGDALDQALAKESWDPSVKSLVPFPQVLDQMNKNLDWTQQLGYAMTEQQSEVMDSVQRLRAQAQAAGQLKTTEQQVVSTEGQTIIIAPAQPSVVYVPAYNPTVVYGGWPYPAYPPVYFPPPPGYVVGSAIAFGVGVAVTTSLWGWARPNWGYGNVNVNVNRYNNINVNRPQINNPNWRPGGSGYRPPAGGLRPPSGPVGKPGRPGGGFPANGIGRPAVTVPGNVTRPPAGMGPGANRPPLGQGGNKLPGNGGGNKFPGNGGGANKLPAKPSGNNRPGGGQFKPGQANKPAARPAIGQGNANRGPGAFKGMNQGKTAGQFQNRGAQSRQVQRPQGGKARAGGGGRPGGGSGGRPGGGGGGRFKK